MSKVAITGNASGTGVFTVASPNSNVDRVLTLPDETGTVDTLQRSGNVVQVVNFQTGAVATGTTVIPYDDTIPQITEGTEFMTLAITPTNANNILLISVVANLNLSAGARRIVALFKDASADALAASIDYGAGGGEDGLLNIEYRAVSGSTNEMTFKVRAGLNLAGTTTFNGNGGARYLGGTQFSSITITELTP